MTRLSPIRISAWLTRPSSSAYTATRSAPSARSRKAIDASASRKVMQGKTVCGMARTLRRGARRVLKEWERRRRPSGELGELAREVRLVGVAAVGGQAGQRRAAEPPPGALEAQHPRRELRRRADLLGEAAGQVPPRAAELRGQLADPHPPAAALQQRPGTQDVGPAAVLRGRERAPQLVVEQREALAGA